MRILSPAANIGKLVLSVVAMCALLPGAARAEGGWTALQVLPPHFRLQPGEAVHYTVRGTTATGKPEGVESFRIESSDPDVVRIGESLGFVHAISKGRARLHFVAEGTDKLIDFEVAGAAWQPIDAVQSRDAPEIKAREVLFVGHAIRDGFDTTAVAKPGIDRWVRRFKEQAAPVVFFVSAEYPDWYTEEVRPTLAVLSEGQEHSLRLDVDRVIFTGGDFMGCTLRNAQFTLHSLLKQGPRPAIHLIFPEEAIWTGDPRAPYPAPMITLLQRLDLIGPGGSDYDYILGFLLRVVHEFPRMDYPKDPPAPPLAELLSDYSIVVKIGRDFERGFKRANAPEPKGAIYFEFVR